MQGVHALIALKRDEPHWLLNDADAKSYGQALSNALRHIPIAAAQKTLDFSMLVIVAWGHEIPRIYLSSQLAKARRASARQQAGGQVFQFRQPQPPPSTAAPPGSAPGLSNPPPGGASAASANGQAPPSDMTYEPEADVPTMGPM